MSIKGPNLTVLILLAIIFTVSLTFITVEAPIILNRVFSDFLGFPDFHPAIEPGIIEDFMYSHFIRPIGYACFTILIILIMVGLVTKRTGLSTVGSIAFFLPTFGYFAVYMFFLSGIGIMRLIWLPIWEHSTNLLKLGDITYIPYMLVVYPLTLISSLVGVDIDSPLAYQLKSSRLVYYYWGEFHIDVRVPLAYVLIGLGLLIFFLGSVAWFNAKIQNKGIVDFFLYRKSRHPQYLGWIVWSYGVMLLASFTPVVRGGVNPGASLPWLISTLLIIHIALAEEVKMIKRYGNRYIKYRDNTPFMFPIHRSVTSMISLPIRMIFGKDRPENYKQIAVTLLVYAVTLVLLSLPFVLFNWPPGVGWSGWPYNTWPFMS